MALRSCFLVAVLAGAGGVTPGVAASTAQITPFKVALSFSPKALARLRVKRERVIIGVAYYANPNAAGRSHIDEIGRIDLGYEKLEVAGKPGVAKLTGKPIDRRKLRWITDDVQVNINIYSARLSGPDNILACDFFEGALTRLSQSGVSLRCSLIEEGAKTDFVS